MTLRRKLKSLYKPTTDEFQLRLVEAAERQATALEAIQDELVQLNTLLQEDAEEVDEGEDEGTDWDEDAFEWEEDATGLEASTDEMVDGDREAAGRGDDPIEGPHRRGGRARS